MVALLSASSCSGPREEPAGSPESSGTTRTPVPTVSSVSPELPVSPGQGAEPPGKNLWEQICEEYEAELPPFPEGYKVKQEPMAPVSPLEEMVFHGFNTDHFFSLPHIAMLPTVPCSQVKLETSDSKTFLLPGLSSLLHQAKKEKCFERKRTKFIACDFLTEWLYNQNPKRIGEPFTEFFSIPFVAEWLKHHPRPPIPLSLLFLEEDAALYIQSFWRGYLVRCRPEIQELRQWQKKLREDKYIRQRVRTFWTKQEQKVKCKMEDDEEVAAKILPS
ncbi:IQ domain-containing protein K isoform X2 [Choloepus didactylus]|uniref:IQ domain-containing protein K isoform X2 n=1 Tax=Choloepus didactylus TaxID=27675 RepID=UPI00189C9C93|nr:IQ domain-containing protein K isoform X2 [Choloepus didactylus]